MRTLINPILKQGTQGLVDLARTAPMMMPEFMDEWFENELLRRIIHCRSHGFSYGPYASATGYQLFYINTYTVMELFITLIF